jgi:hypothetical protein
MCAGPLGSNHNGRTAREEKGKKRGRGRGRERRKKRKP